MKIIHYYSELFTSLLRFFIPCFLTVTGYALPATSFIFWVPNTRDPPCNQSRAPNYANHWVGLNLNGWLDDLQAQPSAGLGSAVYALGNATSLNSTMFNHTLPNQMSQPDFVYGGVHSLCWAAASAQNGSSYALQLGFIAVGGPYRADYVCHREYLCVVAIQGFNLNVAGVQIASG